MWPLFSGKWGGFNREGLAICCYLSDDAVLPGSSDCFSRNFSEIQQGSEVILCAVVVQEAVQGQGTGVGQRRHKILRPIKDGQYSQILTKQSERGVRNCQGQPISESCQAQYIGSCCYLPIYHMVKQTKYSHIRHISQSMFTYMLQKGTFEGLFSQTDTMCTSLSGLKEKYCEFICINQI